MGPAWAAEFEGSLEDLGAEDWGVGWTEGARREGRREKKKKKRNHRGQFIISQLRFLLKMGLPVPEEERELLALHRQ